MPRAAAAPEGLQALGIGAACCTMKALLALAALARAAEPSITAITPINNGEVTLQNGALVMAYAVVANATSDLRLCTQLTNKRVSFESHTHCVDARAPVTSFKLGGFLPGVWRCRAVLRRGRRTGTGAVRRAGGRGRGGGGRAVGLSGDYRARSFSASGLERSSSHTTRSE